MSAIGQKRPQADAIHHAHEARIFERFNHMQEIACQPGGWILYEIAGGRLVLSVNCGTVVSYEISVELSSTEASSYRENGVQSVDALANQVMSYPRQFGARNVTLREEDVVPAPLSWHQ